MSPTAIHRCALVLTGIALLLVAEGAVGVGREVRVSMLHRAGGAAAGAGALVLAWAMRTALPGLATALGAVSLGAILAGGMAEAPALKLAGGVIHALASHLLFALCLVAWFESAPKQRAGAAIEDRGWPPLRSLAWLAPAAILSQIVLGALYRQKAMGIIPHVSWAFVATVLILMTGAFVLTLEAVTVPLKRLASALVATALVQVLLGVAAYFGRVAGSAAWLTPLTVAHVVTGSLLLGIAMALAAQILKNVATVRPLEGVPEAAGSIRH